MIMLKTNVNLSEAQNTKAEACWAPHLGISPYWEQGSKVLPRKGRDGFRLTAKTKGFFTHEKKLKKASVTASRAIA